jgi:PKD repeat protein
MKRIIFFVGILSILCFKHAFPQDTIVLQPGPEGKDSFLDDWYTTPHGDYPNMFAAAGTSNGIPVLMRSVCEFDLSQIPPGSYVLEAKLSFYFANNPSVPHYHYGLNTALLQRITEPWDEATVTWFNQPATTEENQVILPQSTSPEQDYIDIDARDLFQDMVNDPENSYGFLFRIQTEEMYRRMFFASSDYDDPAKWPKLEIIYMGCIPPTANFEYQASGQSVSFTGISPTATSWHWDFGDGDTSNVQNPEHLYEDDGFYQVCLLVEDSCYYAEYCTEIEICTAPPVAGFNYTVDNLTVLFQNTTEIASEFFWDFGDGYFSSVQDPYHTYDSEGEYQVCLIAGNGCGSDTSCSWLDVCSAPISGFDYSIDGFSVYFEDQSERADLYYWDFGDGYYSNLANPWHEYETMGNFEVCLTTWNACGSDTLCDILHMSTVSIQENGEGSFVIYPNPASKKVFVKAMFDGQSVIGIYDLSGKEIIKQDIFIVNGETVEIDLGNMDPGIYIVRIDSGENHHFGKLIVIP